MEVKGKNEVGRGKDKGGKGKDNSKHKGGKGEQRDGEIEGYCGLCGKWARQTSVLAKPEGREARWQSSSAHGGAAATTA
eukprot:2841356-Amphidinium_carterae.1